MANPVKTTGPFERFTEAAKIAFAPAKPILKPEAPQKRLLKKPSARKKK